MGRHPAMSHQTDTLTQPIPMPRHTGLLRRGSRYYLNVKVPKDLRAILKKEIIRKALHTSDPHEAARKVRLESLRDRSVSQFVQTMERRQLTKKGWHSIFSLMRNGRQLATSLGAASSINDDQQRRKVRERT